jgi:hypothetical protein
MCVAVLADRFAGDSQELYIQTIQLERVPVRAIADGEYDRVRRAVSHMQTLFHALGAWRVQGAADIELNPHMPGCIFRECFQVIHGVLLPARDEADLSAPV